MPTTRARKPAASTTALTGTGRKQAPGKRPVTRAKSGLTEIGDEAMRKALLASLKRHRWAFPAVAEELRLSGSANVLRAIRSLGLTAEYEAARQSGAVKPGPRAT